MRYQASGSNESTESFEPFDLSEIETVEADAWDFEAIEHYYATRYKWS